MEHERLTKREVSQELPEAIIKKTGNNTFNVTYPNGDKALRYHHTDVITLKPNGDMILNTDGYLTSTTKERINTFLFEGKALWERGWNVYQKNKIWYLSNKSQKWTFQDGITIHNDGTVTGNGTDPKNLLKLDKKILKYVNGFVTALFEGKIGKPSNSDCWYCLMRVGDSDKTLGEATNDNHILNHFKEKYYVPSLLMRAIEIFPVSQAAQSSIGYYLKYHDQKCEWFDNIAKVQIKSSLKRYLRRQLGLAS